MGQKGQKREKTQEGVIRHTNTEASCNGRPIGLLQLPLVIFHVRRVKENMQGTVNEEDNFVAVGKE
jgi:hypothetical protein